MDPRYLRGAIVAVILAVLVYGLLPERAIFSSLTGPLAATALPKSPLPTAPELYYAPANDSSHNSMAILLRDKSSSWLGLVHGLKSIGVPFHIVSSVDEAVQHRVVLVYPSLIGGTTAPADLQKLATHVRSGGTLLAFDVIGGGMPEVFGFGHSEEVPLHKLVQLQTLPLTAGLIDDAVAATIRLGSPDEPDTGLPGISYTDLKQPPLAVFEDGSAAITCNSFQSSAGTGYAYAFGFDIGHYILRAQDGRFVGLAGTYVNAYQPQVDTFLRLLAAIYRQGEPEAVTLLPTPHNKEFTALMTHDIDFTQSMTNIPAYTEVEKAAGVKATYFIQAKYMKDYNDDVFLNPAHVPILQSLKEQAMEIASHSIAHSRVFDDMPVGDGHEQYPAYRPFVTGVTAVKDASIMGELRVSKFLLDTLAGVQVISFRPGHLSLPTELPQLLVANGYRYSSSITANEAMTHLPYRLMDSRGYDSEVNAYEFPVTIEDEEGKLGDRFDAAVALTNHIARYQGLVNILIHTDVLDHKLDFEKRYLELFAKRAWFSTVQAYGDWWAVRDSVQTAVSAESASSRRVRLTAVGTIDGLTLQIPAHWHYQSGLAGTTQQDAQLILGKFTDKAEVVFDLDPRTALGR